MARTRRPVERPQTAIHYASELTFAIAPQVSHE
jgi:hypothetical protein